MQIAVPAVLAVDVFDKFNFTGAWVPRFEDIHGDFPHALVSSVFFSADFFKPPERRGNGRCSEPPGGPQGHLPRWGRGGVGKPVLTPEHVLWVHAAGLPGIGVALGGSRPEWPWGVVPYKYLSSVVK